MIDPLSVMLGVVVCAVVLLATFARCGRLRIVVVREGEQPRGRDGRFLPRARDGGAS